MTTLNRFAAIAAVLALAACTPAPVAPESPEAAARPGTVAEAEKREEDLGEVVVTGSRARRARLAEIATPLMIVAPAPPQAVIDLPAVDRETYGRVDANPVNRAAEQPVSTFSIDVDTGSYSNVRRILNAGRLPPGDAVRVEELVNYFNYAYEAPRDAATPFGVVTEIAPTPWNPKTRLLQVGIQGWKPPGPAPASNLVFLVDVSGSMQAGDKLPLVKASLRLLARQLTARDRISLVVYAGSTGVVLEPTPGSERAAIEAALAQLEAGGSTNGRAGIELAYAMAGKAFIPGGNNRVLLATDGDFNVGTVSFEALVSLVEEKRKGGVALTTLGFGTGNYNDHLMERLADAGNGNHAYIDTLGEAERALVAQRDATLTTIAKDVKVQVEFNPALVAEYRLIGYENRLLRREDFNNDKVDAGEIGAGHAVTALYEIALRGSGGERVEPLRYGRETAAVGGADEIAFVKLRYKRPEDGMQAASRLIQRTVRRDELRKDAASASPQFRLAAAVAAYGQLLRGGKYTGDYRYADVIALARSAPGLDPASADFLKLASLADGLSTPDAEPVASLKGTRPFEAAKGDAPL
jgi:Ca-activated chloride channel family protein